MEVGQGGGARYGALHRLLWNSRAGATAPWRGDYQSRHFAPAYPVQRVAHNGMSLAEFQRVMDEYLVWYSKRRPHWPLEILAPHEKFHCSKLAISA
jgi:hypothetical protein